MEAGQTAVTPVSCHTGFAAAPARTVAASAQRTFGVAVAGQAAVPLPLPVEAVLAPLAARAIRVVVAVEAAESVPRLSAELGIKHALPGLAIAVTHFDRLKTVTVSLSLAFSPSGHTGDLSPQIFRPLPVS